MSQKHADNLLPIDSQKDEQYSDLKKDFSHIFFENNLNQFSNGIISIFSILTFLL